MNILTNYRLNTFNPINKNNISYPQFGIKMAAPLSCDTISFTGTTQTKKNLNDRKDTISIDLAMQIQASIADAHTHNEKLFKRKFADILSSDYNKNRFSTTFHKNLITMDARLKSPESIQEKSGTRGWATKKDILHNMGDVSGFCFILEDKKSFPEFIKRFSEMIQKGDIKVKEVEYHRIAPEYKKNNVFKSFDSLPQNQFAKLKKTIMDKQCPTSQFWWDVDSVSGYSGLHITIKNQDGTLSEIQVMTRAMANFKDTENLLYKIRNNKSVNKKYRFIEQFLAPLKVEDPDNMTEQEKALQKAMKKYTKEAYTNVLSNLYKDNYDFLKVDDATSLTKKEKNMIRDYDFNTIHKFIETCNNVDSNKH